MVWGRLQLGREASISWNTDSPNMGRGLPDARKIGLFRERGIEIANRIHSIEEAKEVYFDSLTAEGGPEVLHVPLLLLCCFVRADAHLVFLVRSVSKRYHLFVAFGEQANGRDHPSQEAGGESTSGKAEDEDLVTWVMIPHDKAISCNDMRIEACAESLVEGLGPPALYASPEPLVDGFFSSYIGANASYTLWSAVFKIHRPSFSGSLLSTSLTLVVVKLFWRSTIEFLIQFDNVRVRGISRVSISGTIKAAQQLAMHFLVLGRAIKRRSLRQAVHGACYLARRMERKKQVRGILKDCTRSEIAAYQESSRFEGRGRSSDTGKHEEKARETTKLQLAQVSSIARFT